MYCGRMCLRRAARLAGLAPLLALAAAPVAAQASGLPVELPAELPDLSGWEQSSGWAELADPAGSLEYRLYVDPDRNAIYGVTYYRVRVRDEEPDHVSGNAKLQWIIDGRVVRRFECEPVAAARVGGECEWREHRPASPAYDAELGVVLRIYSLHRELLRARDRGEVERPRGSE